MEFACLQAVNDMKVLGPTVIARPGILLVLAFFTRTEATEPSHIKR